MTIDTGDAPIRYSNTCACGVELVTALPEAFLTFWRTHDKCLNEPLDCEHPGTEEKFRELICSGCRFTLAYRIGAYRTTFP